MKARCRFTGKPIQDPSEGFYDDGDWISWEYIASLGEEDEDAELGDFDDRPQKVDFFEALREIAKQYHQEYGRYLSIWGELGELYAEVQYGLKLNKLYAEGSDGTVGKDHVEVKTISPMKNSSVVEVKRSGNFNVLVVVKINEDFSFESRWIERKDLGKGNGKIAKYDWDRS